MNAETRTTSNHDAIRRWVEAHDGVPATVRGTHDGQDAAGVLRFDFPGGAGRESLKHISWDARFDKFDGEGLQLLYQAKRSDGGDSTFFKIVAPDRGVLGANRFTSGSASASAAAARPDPPAPARSGPPPWSCARASATGAGAGAPAGAGRHPVSPNSALIGLRAVAGKPRDEPVNGLARLVTSSPQRARTRVCSGGTDIEYAVLERSGGISTIPAGS